MILLILSCHSDLLSSPSCWATPLVVKPDVPWQHSSGGPGTCAAVTRYLPTRPQLFPQFFLGEVFLGKNGTPFLAYELDFRDLIGLKLRRTQTRISRTICDSKIPGLDGPICRVYINAISLCSIFTVYELKKDCPRRPTWETGAVAEMSCLRKSHSNCSSKFHETS